MKQVGEEATGGARPRGPRRDGNTREAILRAARARFAAQGYAATRMRDVAADAAVDPALVSYHFGNKDGLFAAAMALKVNPATLLEQAVAGPVDTLGERLVRLVLELWGDPRSAQPLAALVRSAASHEQAALMLRGFVEQELAGRVAAVLDDPQADLRAALTGSQLIGLAIARYVVGVRPLAGADVEDVVAAVAPNLQRYLTGPLDAP